MKKARFIWFLLATFIIAISCQEKEPNLIPFPGEIESEGITEQGIEDKDFEEGFGFETREITIDEGKIQLQAIIETGGLGIPKDLNNENIKKGMRPDQVENAHIESWIIFLITDFSFLERVNIFNIKESFKNLGKSIFDQHLAVWISDKRGNPDIEKMRYYCYEKFGLDFNHGPYVVITKIHPDERKKDDHFFRLKFYAIDADRISELLNTIAFKINENKIKTLDLFIEEKIALLKSHVSKTLGIPKSIIEKIF